METVNETWGLVKRQAELENAMQSAWRHRITEEQELHATRSQPSKEWPISWSKA